jgi:hypothetical protein
MSDKDDVIKNPNRNNNSQIPVYEPEWVRLGKKPIQIQMPRKTIPLVKSSKNDEKRDFSSLNGAIFDEEGKEIKVEQGHIIDNNDYVFPPSMTNSHQAQPKTQQEDPKNEQETVQGQPKVGEYILLVLGKIIHTGSIDQIESVARAILYGENEQFIDQEVKVDDIVILKRIGINVGIFIDR